MGLLPWLLNKSRPRRTARPILLAYCFHISQDAPNGVESPLCSLPNLLSLPKDASLHLRKLARHLIGRMPECRDVHGCTRTTMPRLTQFVYSPCGNSEGMVYSLDFGVICKLLRHKSYASLIFYRSFLSSFWCDFKLSLCVFCKTAIKK